LPSQAVGGAEAGDRQDETLPDEQEFTAQIEPAAIQQESVSSHVFRQHVTHEGSGEMGKRKEG
jgi:hypothetical protein